MCAQSQKTSPRSTEVRHLEDNVQPVYMQASDVLAKLHSESQPLPHLTDLFRVGQLVRCTIVSLEQQSKAGSSATKNAKGGKKAVHLSLQGSKVNAGLTADALQVGLALAACVTSIEDHGYGLTFGVKGTNGFLPKKVHAKAYGSASVLKPGQLVECVVTSVAKRLVKVSTDPEALNGAVLQDWDGMHIGEQPVTSGSQQAAEQTSR